MKYDVVSLGEVLIDLTQTGVEGGVPRYAANPGGAPANAAVACARMGCRTAFVGRVGDDAFGRQLRSVLEGDGVDVTGLSVDSTVPTTLAVVSVDGRGERSFLFYRSPGADLTLTGADIPGELLEGCTFLHFGSVSLTAEPARSAVLEAAAHAKAHGAYISYDPNYRPSLWGDEETAVTWMRKGLELADVVKLSDEETALLTGEVDPARAARALTGRGVKLAFITLGAQGALYRMGEEEGVVPGIPVTVADTNGTGDTFLGSALSRLVKLGKPLEELTGEEVRQVTAFANRAAALTASRPGAIPAIPTLEEVEGA